MKKLLLATTAAIALYSAPAMAALSNEDIIALYPGASHIEVQRTATTTKVEVIIGDRKIEAVYANDDANTVLSYEEKTLSPEELADALDDDTDDDTDDDDSDIDDDDEGDDDDGDDDDEGDDDDDDDDDDEEDDDDEGDDDDEEDDDDED